MKKCDFLHAHRNLGKLNLNLVIIGWLCSKMGETFQITWESKIRCMSQMI